MVADGEENTVSPNGGEQLLDKERQQHATRDCQV
jgi:hypothetical protein